MMGVGLGGFGDRRLEKGGSSYMTALSLLAHAGSVYGAWVQRVPRRLGIRRNTMIKTKMISQPCERPSFTGLRVARHTPKKTIKSGLKALFDNPCWHNFAPPLTIILHKVQIKSPFTTLSPKRFFCKLKEMR